MISPRRFKGLSDLWLSCSTIPPGEAFREVLQLKNMEYLIITSTPYANIDATITALTVKSASNLMLVGIVPYKQRFDCTVEIVLRNPGPINSIFMKVIRASHVLVLHVFCMNNSSD